MRRIVVDAATVLSWFDGTGADQRREYEAGEFVAMAPRRLHADLLATIAARGRTRRDRLARIAGELPRIGIQLQDPPLAVLAGWIARGLDAEVAAYAALAEHLDMRLHARDSRLRDGAKPLIDG
jgi:predicted nucleic acid-binding protein